MGASPPAVARLSGCARVASYLRSDRRDEQLIALLASRLSEGYVFDTQPAWLRSQLVADESKPQIRKSRLRDAPLMIDSVYGE